MAKKVAITRYVEARPVTIVCENCGREVTEERLPGPVPKYCKTCAPIVARRKAAERARARYYAMKQEREAQHA